MEGTNRGIMRIRNKNLKSVTEIVTSNTGMTVDELLNDKREWTYDFSEFFELLSLMKPERIIIIGDYDDDGVWSTKILKSTLSEMVGETTQIFVRLPHRISEGYGTKPCQLIPFDLTKRDLVITIDNGVTALDAISYAKSRRSKVVIMDHHQPIMDKDKNIILPEADLIYDAHFDEKSNFTDWCAGGMAAMLTLQAPVSEKQKKKAIVGGAIATVGDSVRLVDGNRWLLKKGLYLINNDKESRGIGLEALLFEMKCENYIDEMTVGFSIVPCINAIGRLKDDGAEKALELMDFQGDLKTAQKLAERLIIINEERKRLTAFWAEKCFKFVEEKGYDKDKSIVISNRHIHEGIVGIIAGKLMERYNRPSFVFTDHSDRQDLQKGSGRSAQGVNMKELLDRHRDLLFTYGGHSGAAGMTIEKTNYRSFRDALNEDLKDIPYIEEDIIVDLIVNINDLRNVIKEYDR